MSLNGGRARRALPARSGAVQAWFLPANRPDVVVLAGRRWADSGQLTYPADFLLENLKDPDHVIETPGAPWGAPAVVFSAASCHLPEIRPQPITEESLPRGPLGPNAGMRSPRSPASNSAGPCASSTALCDQPDAPPISTGPGR